MKTVNVLLANSERRLNNLIEGAVRDVCYNQVLVECVITNRLDELLDLGCRKNFGLIFVSPGHLVWGPARRALPVTIADAAEVIRSIKAQCIVPIIGVGIRPEQEDGLLEAGADSCFGVVFNRDEMRAELRRVLMISEQVEPEQTESRISFIAGLLRGWQKLRQA